MSAAKVLESEFLHLRARLLDIAATFDRLDRAEGEPIDDPRLMRIREAMAILLRENGDRAEQIQLVFSRAYDDDWSTKIGLTL
jgi:hypothetical protein